MFKKGFFDEAVNIFMEAMCGLELSSGTDEVKEKIISK
jgi:hypothetical protein